MAVKKPRRASSAQETGAQGARARVRRGNVDDALRLKGDLTSAALALFVEQGLSAVSMRAVAERVGVSTMTPYRYFEDKAALLASLWESVLQSLLATLRAAADGAPSGGARVAATTEAFMRYWESHADEFRLVFQTQHAAHRSERPGEDQVLVYSELRDLLRLNTEGLAAELAVSTVHAKLAEDMAHTMMQGYLIAAMVNRRYPWGDIDILRATAVRQVVACMVQCLREGPAAAEEAAA